MKVKLVQSADAVSVVETVEQEATKASRRCWFTAFNTKVPTSPNPWPSAGSFRRLQVNPGPGYWLDGAADIFDIAMGYQQRSASEPGPRRRSSFCHSVAPASLYLAGAS